MKEAIVLAGGFGTRLQHIVNDVPKPMAPINGEPFLSYLFRRLLKAGVTHVILSTGYLHEKIESFYGEEFEGMRLTYSCETEPLGTGGAILFGMEKALSDKVLVLNGDTLFDIQFDALYDFHAHTNAVLSVALRQVDDVARYGSVQTNTDGRIVSFTEKNEVSGEGLINGGIYLIDKKWFTGVGLPAKFSFEKEVLETAYKESSFYGLNFQSYFIDIGVPDDYARAQTEFKSL